MFIYIYINSTFTRLYIYINSTCLYIFYIKSDIEQIIFLQIIKNNFIFLNKTT